MTALTIGATAIMLVLCTGVAEPVAPDPQPEEVTLPALRTLSVRAYGYSLPGRTRMGTPVRWGVVAVDPSVIPMGSRLAIEGFPGMIFVAEDTGGGIHGNTIDIYFNSVQEALNFGVRQLVVTVLP